MDLLGKHAVGIGEEQRKLAHGYVVGTVCAFGDAVLVGKELRHASARILTIVIGKLAPLVFGNQRGIVDFYYPYTTTSRRRYWSLSKPHAIK